jgi:hypothetical protein
MTHLQHLFIDSETTYDLFQDHLDLMIDLANKPLPLPVVQQRLHNPLLLNRLVEHKLVHIEHATVHPTAHIYHQKRQESMARFLQRYVLPSLLSHTQHTSQLHTCYMHLTPQQIAHFHHTVFPSWIEAVAHIAEHPITHHCQRLTLIHIGTTHVHTHLEDHIQEALIHARAASLQKTNPALARNALLSQIDCTADTHRYHTLCEAMETRLKEYTRYACKPTDATYHFTYATCWHHTSETPIRNL